MFFTVNMYVTKLWIGYIDVSIYSKLEVKETIFLLSRYPKLITIRILLFFWYVLSWTQCQRPN